MMMKTKARTSSQEVQRERDNLKTAYQAAVESIVLLENEGMLPMQPGKIALFGAGAGMTIEGGSGSGEVNERHSVTILEGLENAGFTVTTKPWIEDYAQLYRAGEKAYKKEFRKRLRPSMNVIINLMAEPYRYPFGQPVTQRDIESSNTDTCIYVVARQAGEGADRRLDLYENDLSPQELENIKACAAAYRHFMVVINVGATFDLGFLDQVKNIGAVVFHCQQGSEGGTAFADLVTGKVSPSGRLAVSWAKKYRDIPFADEFYAPEGCEEHAVYKEGLYVGYRYFDSFRVAPRYEFGYGLSYTDFSVAAESVTLEKTRVTVWARVQNIGNTYAAKEVAQLYVSCPQGELHREYQHLAAFGKTRTLAPGESQTLKLTFDLTDLAAYREADAYSVLEKGEYLLRLGQSSRKTAVCGAIVLQENVVTAVHRHVCVPAADIQELTPPDFPLEPLPEGLPRLTARKVDFTPCIHQYQQRPSVSDDNVDGLMEKLTTEDRIELVVGAGVSGDDRWFDAPGAAGATTSKLLDKGIVNAVLADGPAGLRLQRTSAVTKRGKVKMIDAPNMLYNMLPDIFKAFLFGNPKKDTLLYQYTTAFPVGMALAQSWNTELLEQVGRAVSREMREYGVSYWLAPAMNIQRNPLCGRSYEYYSEDPLLTGRLAGAVTRGVQSTPGNYVVVKHFACCNQENNRTRVSADLRERTLREIYLKGFAIAIREGRAAAVMTSYNKINGIYAANSHDLCTKVLRQEWGFDGVVMTDWLSTVKGLADSAEALAAGNDLMMPGTVRDRRVIQTALKKGTLDEEDLRRCCANVLRGVVNSSLAREMNEKNKAPEPAKCGKKG